MINLKNNSNNKSNNSNKTATTITSNHKVTWVQIQLPKNAKCVETGHTLDDWPEDPGPVRKTTSGSSKTNFLSEVSADTAR